MKRRHTVHAAAPQDDTLTGILSEEQSETQFDEEQFNQAMDEAMPTTAEAVEDIDDTEDIQSYDDSEDDEETITVFDDEKDSEEAEEIEDEEPEEVENEEIMAESEDVENEFEDAEDEIEDVEDDEEAEISKADDASVQDISADSEDNTSSHRFADLDKNKLSNFQIFDISNNGQVTRRSYQDMTQNRINARKDHFRALMERHETYREPFTRTTTITETDEQGNQIRKEAIASVYQSDILVCIPYDKYESETFWREHGAYEGDEIQPAIVHDLLSRRLGSFIICDIEDLGEGDKVIANRLSASKRIQENIYLADNAPLHPPLPENGIAVNSSIIQVRRDSLILDTYGVETVMPVRDIFLTYVSDLRLFFRNGDRLLCLVTDVQVDDHQQVHLGLSHLATNYSTIIDKMENYQSGDTLQIRITYKSEDNQFGLSADGVPCMVPIDGRVPVFNLGDRCTVRVRKVIYSERPILATTYVMGQSTRNRRRRQNIL